MRCVAEFSTALTWMKSLRSTGSAIYRCVYEHIPRSVDLDLYCQLQDIYSDSINWLLQRKYTPKLHKAIIFFILHCGFLKIYSMNLAWVFSRTNPINISVSCSQMSCIPLRHRSLKPNLRPQFPGLRHRRPKWRERRASQAGEDRTFFPFYGLPRRLTTDFPG